MPTQSRHAPSSPGNILYSTCLLGRVPAQLRRFRSVKLILEYSYLIVEKVIYMCICDSSYPRKLAFSYLDELSKEFQRSYGDKIESVTRPYAFMGFG